MAASQSECLAISGDENGDSNGLISDSNEKGNDPIQPNNQLSIIGQELNSGIINQYGQLVGEYSKLDDELWLPNSEDVDDVGEMWNDGLGYEIVASHKKMIDLERPLAISWEPLPGYVEHPVSDGHIAPVEDNSCTLKDSSENQFQTPSPVSVLKRKRSYSSAKGSMSSQNKYRQPTKDSSSGGVRFSGSTNPNGEQSQADQSGSEYSMESSLSDETDEPVPLQKVRTRKISDLLDSNHSNQAAKKCLHCETTETPQWRTGPMGRKTLCNACGVQYKHGRLFADYRPLRSPTFDPALHFSVPKKVQELRMGYTSEKGPNVASKTKIVKEKKKANKIREEDPTFIPKLKKVKGTRMNNRYERNPYPTFKPNKVQELRMDKTYEIDLNTTPDCNNVEEMRMDNDNGIVPNLVAEPRRPEETRMSNNSNMGENLLSEHKSVEEMSRGNNNAREEKCAQRANNIHNSTERASNCHDSDSYVRNKNIESGLIQQRKQKVARKCTHCASTETPQWREGPEGRFTLCNACGVQYRNGRLFPEYRPLKSPTYDPLLHSYLPKKVQEMRMRMGIAEKSVTSGNCQDPA